VKEPAYLIVNADDYGYSDGISRGILDGGKEGLITATGVIANSYHCDKHLQWLKDAPYLDVGVHLTLTCGRPISGRMKHRMARWQGRFPGKYSIASEVLTSRLPVKDILEEWRAQIERCKGAGIELLFLNTHEHLHALPPLFSAVLKLAKEYGIPHVRCPEPEWRGWRGMEGMVRNTILHFLHLINHARIPDGTPKLLGIAESGKLSLNYLKHRLASLRKGEVYELMCHPGYADPEEIKDPRLCSYHNWQEELDLLKSGEFRSLCDVWGIQVVRYTDIQGNASKKTVQAE